MAPIVPEAAVLSPKSTDFRGSYPAAETGDQIDEYHGVNVTDPYRWMEDDIRTSPKLEAWVDAQNELTFKYLNSTQRDGFLKRLTALWDYERVSIPHESGGKYFFSKNDGLQNHAVWYVADSLDGEPRVVLDPNTLSEDGSVSISGFSTSNDGSLAAYAMSSGGSDWQTIKVLDVKTGKHLSGDVEWAKFTSVEWTEDNKGFFYSRYPAPRADAMYQQKMENHSLYYHSIGQSQEKDVLVFDAPLQPSWAVNGTVSDDGNWLVMGMGDIIGINAVSYRNLREPYATTKHLVPEQKEKYEFIGSKEHLLFFLTNWNAPNNRIIAVDTRNDTRENWKEIVKEEKEAIEVAAIVENFLTVTYLKDAHSKVKLFYADGEFIRDVALPGMGSVQGFDRLVDNRLMFGYGGFTTPFTTYKHNIITGENTVWKQPNVSFTPDDFTTKQIFVTSQDGTQVPAFVIGKKDLDWATKLPTVLYGYGGFDVSLSPFFSPGIISWCESGGLWVVAILRGGGEYGKNWHEAGMKGNKQNVFDDFIAVAENLISMNYTTPDLLAINGGSNGGLLVGAVMAQRPELFGAAIPEVGVLDMLRFHKFTAGAFWVGEYGSSDNKEDFEWLNAYSPYHYLLRGESKPFPPTLIATGDTDDRVVPGHSFKFAAALQTKQSGTAPIFLRVERKVGHGAGTSTTKRLELAADRQAFLTSVLM